MSPLAQQHITHIEGFIPDLCEGLTTDKERRDSVYDCACDYIYDTMSGYPVPAQEEIATAANEIAEYYFGKEKDDDN